MSARLERLRDPLLSVTSRRDLMCARCREQPRAPDTPPSTTAKASSMRIASLLCWSPFLCLVACEVADLRGRPASTPAAGLASEVANGPRDAADSGANPLAGAFFNDGGTGDVRARTENYFRDTDGDGLPDQAVQGETRQRLLIQTAALSLEVPRPETAIADFVAKAQAAGGYLSSQQQLQVTVRVPAAKFEAVLADLRGLGRVFAETRQAQDVTKQYFDLGVRLDSAKRARERLLALLEKATNVKEMLEVETELRRVIEEIERLEGEQRFLADQVAMSSIAATFRSTVTAPPEPKPRRREPSRFRWLEAVGAERLAEDF